MSSQAWIEQVERAQRFRERQPRTLGQNVRGGRLRAQVPEICAVRRIVVPDVIYRTQRIPLQLPNLPATFETTAARKLLFLRGSILQGQPADATRWT